MDLHTISRKEVGNIGEKVAAEYLRRHGFRIVEQNYARKTGELDIVARVGETLHIVEVKTILTEEFPQENSTQDAYDPSLNLHESKLEKIARTAEWYTLEHDWGGEWQVDGCLVWLRRRDGMAHVRYLPRLI